MSETLPPPSYELPRMPSVVRLKGFNGHHTDVELLVEAYAADDENNIIATISKEIFLADNPTPDIRRQGRLFAGAPALIFEAFKEAGLPKPIAPETLRRVNDRTAMREELLISNNFKKAVRVVSIAKSGIENHPETKPLLNGTEKYFAKKYNSEGVGASARYGMGYALGLLDHAWEDVRLQMAIEEAETEAGAADWGTIEQWLQKAEE